MSSFTVGQKRKQLWVSYQSPWSSDIRVIFSAVGFQASHNLRDSVSTPKQKNLKIKYVHQYIHTLNKAPTDLIILCRFAKLTSCQDLDEKPLLWPSPPRFGGLFHCLKGLTCG